MAKFCGFNYHGVQVKAFSVNLLTIGGECAAQEEIAELGLADVENPTVTQQRLIDLAYLAQQVSFEKVPKNSVTAQFLFDNLLADDYWAIFEAILELRKKQYGDGESEEARNQQATAS